MGNWCYDGNKWVAARCGVDFKRIYIASQHRPFFSTLSPTPTTLLLMPESILCCWGCLLSSQTRIYLFILYMYPVDWEEEEGEVMIMVLW